MKKRLFYFITLECILFFANLEAQTQFTFKIVVNKNNSLVSISKKQLSNIFLKKIYEWDDGLQIQPVDLVTSDCRKNFSKEILQKSIPAIKAYWQNQIFTGRGIPPPEKANDQEVLKYVQSHKGAIGYISSNTKIKNYDIKILEIKE